MHDRYLQTFICALSAHITNAQHCKYPTLEKTCTTGSCLETGQSQFRAESLESLLFWAEKARACTISGACYHKMRAEFERWNLARACMSNVRISDTAVERTCMQSEKRRARMHDRIIRLFIDRNCELTGFDPNR